jgi:peroxiredoxin
MAFPLDFELPDSNGEKVHLANLLEDNEVVVVVFYDSYTNILDLDQLRELESDLAQYHEKGAQLVAVAVQTEFSASKSVEKTDAHFPILSDEDGAVSMQFDVFIPGPEESNPSVFIMDQDGQIIWQSISDTYAFREASAVILANLP